MTKTTLEEKSAGGVVFKREGAGKPLFLIGKHSGYHKWVLPKGLVERGESQGEAAVREVEEEVGVKARITDVAPLKTIEYYYFADLGTVSGEDAKGKSSERRVKKYQEEGGAKVRVHKQVIFYLMEVEADLGKEGWEMEERKWVSFADGLKELAFETEREVFEAAGKELGCL
jgi:8-oxo-dGTP pyrophosphatase MutT (NUDIX family)